MHPSLRRFTSVLPDAAAAARTASTPQAVRLRRLRKRPSVSTGQSDATATGLTPTEHANYQRQLAKGELMGPDGKELTEGEWLSKLNNRRGRIRGVREVIGKDGVKEQRVVGQKVYLPNIIFRLVRNHTPLGSPYNPYEATFRVPQSVTKTDIRSYLLAVYGVKTTYIRTDNYLAPVPTAQRAKSAYKTYKRAVVGLVEPFYYPQSVEDMSPEEKTDRETWLEDKFSIKETENYRKMEFLRITRAPSKDWRWRNGSTAQRGNILKRIAEQRAAREEVILEAKIRMQAERVKAAGTTTTA